MENQRRNTRSGNIIPPSTPSPESERRSNKRVKYSLVKFKPKVSPDASSSSCRRVLDFGSVKTKTMNIYTRSGHCFTRKVTYIEDPSSCLNKKDGRQVKGKKWLKEDQELFRRRASSFICSMRSVQGYRPFMGWKGSVVDSVVGVFLTQNATDSSSSSAFMNLAAKFPSQIITGKRTEHTINWDAVRTAQRSKISKTIDKRGMNNRIAKRIQEFLDSVHDDKTGLIDLEWLRNATAEEAKHYFMDVYGLGIKSTECLRLLTLRQRAFPVDRHVCRIVVRLGWVPLETLPDGVLLHQLNEYPNNKDVQEYLSRRLSILDVDTLYELHYQMITFGKVYCTKTKPNCDSCPLKNECKHFASAYISGGEKTVVPSTRVLSTPELVDIEDLCLGPMVSKISGRLRTKHQVYELPDTHPLVKRLDERDPDDETPYLFVVWRPVDESSGRLQQEETTFGTFLVPRRTATRGSFPLDGTYFQINEVFADDDTSENPIVVPQKLLLNLTTNTLYCGTSISNISEGMSSKERQECFLKGYVCIRGFDMKTKEPKSLHCRFHQTKTVKPSRKLRVKNNGTNNLVIWL